MAQVMQDGIQSTESSVGMEDDFHIEQLFGSKTRVRLIGLFLENPERAYYVRELTRRIDAQLNSVRRELSNLIEMGILLEVEGKILEQEVDDEEEGDTADVKKRKKASNDKKKFYQANTDFIFFDELRSIMKKASVLSHKSVVRGLVQKGRIDLLFMTGKFVDDDAVPSDLLIVGQVDAPVLQETIDEFEKMIGWEINYTYMPRDEFLYRREVKDRFLASIMNSEKIILVDELREEL